MKKILPLLLMVFVMCQCHNNPSKPQTEPVKTAREMYPEKFTESYISERTLWLADEVRGLDDRDESSYKPIFTERYYNLLTEAFALPKEFITELAGAWVFVELVEPLCDDLVVNEVKMLDDTTAQVGFDCNYGKCTFVLSFEGDDWLIDDYGNYSRAYMAEMIHKEREWLKSLNFQEMLEEFEGDEVFTKEEYDEMVEGFREETEAYFAKYPDK